MREALASAAVFVLLLLLLSVAWRYATGTLGWGTAMAWLGAMFAGTFGCLLWGTH